MKAWAWFVIWLCFYVYVTGVNEHFVLAEPLPAIGADIIPGDLVFRKGTGLFSNYFMKAGNKPAPFSHVGLIFRQEGQLNVIHSEASEFTGVGGVRSEPLMQFLSEGNSKASAVYRISETA